MRYIKDMTKYEGLNGWERISLSDWVRNITNKYSDRIAIVDSQREVTYRELDREIDEIAYGLYKLGIAPKDKVIVQIPNRLSFVITLFAVIRIGAIPILALPAHRETEIEGIIKVASPKAYIVAEKYMGFDYLPMAKRIKEESSSLEFLIVDGERGGDYLIKDIIISGREVMDSGNGSEDFFTKSDGYDTGVLLLSGGTTGVPKLIPRTHTDYLYNGRMSALKCRADSNSVYLAALPVAHNFPLCCPGIIGILDVGGKVVLASNTTPDEILNLISEEKVTITALVPAMLNLCLEMSEWDEDIDISSLEILQVGGAMLEESLAQKVIDIWSDCKLMQVFGTAEGLLCFTNLADDDEVVVNCQGKPISEADEVKIVDSDLKEVPRGEFGELLSRGPYTIPGYFNADEVNRISFTEDGFYRTGDRAMWTEEGNIRMGGRIKEQINRAGEKITPSEVEALLCQNERIKEAVVVGVPDEELGFRSCSFILSEDGEEFEREEIYHFLKNKGLAGYKIPDQVENIDVWPLTSVGKIDKKQLVKLAQNVFE